jgi:polyketide synthase 7
MTHTWHTDPAVLVFSGQGSQWAGMAAELLDSSTVFAERLRKCASAIEEFVPWSVESVLRQEAGAPSLDLVEVVQPVLFAVNVALAELWMASGLMPGAVVGQSQGEVAAACVAGALTLSDAARIIVGRSQLFADELVGRGGIACVGLPADAIEPHLRDYGGRLDVAGVIGPDSVTIAGELAALDDLLPRLSAAGVWVKRVAASIPSHCAAIEPLRERLVDLLSGIRPQPSRIPLYSTVTGAEIDGTQLTADYWYANARRPVLFDPVIRLLLDNGFRIFVESSPHPVLTAAIAATAETVGRAVTVTGTLRRGSGGMDQFQAALATVPITATPATAAA